MLYIFPTEFCPWKFHFCIFQFGDYEPFYRTLSLRILRFKMFSLREDMLFSFYQPGCNEPGTTLCYYCILGFTDHTDYVNSNHNPFGGWLWFQNVRGHTHTPVWSLCQKKKVFFILPVFLLSSFLLLHHFLEDVTFQDFRFHMKVSVPFGGLVFCYHKTVKTQNFGNWDGWMPPWQQWHKCQPNKLVFTSLLTFGLWVFYIFFARSAMHFEYFYKVISTWSSLCFVADLLGLLCDM